MKMKKRTLLLLCCFIFTCFLKAQIYPVQVITQLSPPYSGYLPDYADPGSEKLKVILQFNDFTVSQYKLKLRFEIKGNGFTMVTKALYNPSPITLEPGQPLLLSGADLAQYLSSANLDITGLNQSTYEQRMALPEGYYSICVKAYDYYTPGNIQVSNEGCANAWFTYSNPPFLNLPFCNSVVNVLQPQNVMFQWTPVNLGSPNSAFNTYYDFMLYEMRPDSNVNANQLVQSAPPVYSVTTQQTFLNYGITEPPLNQYMKYVWRVRVRDISGRDWFVNDGFSQICMFTYGTARSVLGASSTLSLNCQAISHRLGRGVWNTQSAFSSYLLQVRKENTNNWFDYPTSENNEKIPNLEPNTSYEARVRGEGLFTSEWSNVETFTTPPPPNYNCNDQNVTPDILPAKPLPASKAIMGLVIQSGQFEILAQTMVPKGPAGWYSGTGKALVFGALPVDVKWNNIYIDDNNRHQQGVIEALTNGIDNWLQQWDLTKAQANAHYVNGKIDSVKVTNNEICYSFEGSSDMVCIPTPTGTNVFVLRDEEGNEYRIQLVPPPPKVTGPFSYLAYSDDALEANDSIKVVFEEYSSQKFGFDKKEHAAFIDNYEVIKLSNGKNYFIPNKSIGESDNDGVVASFTVVGNTDPQIIFKTKSSTLIASTKENGKFRLSGIPSNAECVYAYYNNKKIGKLNVISLKPLGKKLVLVSVNGANVNLTASELNDIYKQANVTWTVSSISGFTFDLGNDGLEGADATLLSKYSTEMRALRDAYKAKDSAYDKSAYFLFVVPGFKDPNLDGYMVRGRALGFVKSGASPKDIAHELAHGAFSLEHTFPKSERKSTENLMDYNQGTGLVKDQWLKISEEIHVLNWFDDEEDASLFGFDLSKYLKDKFGLQCYETYKNYDGVIPQCFWNNSICPITIENCYGTALVCGIIDGVFVTIKDIFNIAEFVDCWSPLGLKPDPAKCILIQNATEKTIETIRQICNDPNGTSLIYSTIKNSLKDWAGSTFCTDKTCAYNQGRLIFDVVSLFYGVGEVKAALKTGIAGVKIANIIRETEVAVNVAKGLIKTGGKVFRNGVSNFIYVKIGGKDFTLGKIVPKLKAIDIDVPIVEKTSASVLKAEIKDVSYIVIEDGKELVRKGDIEILEENGVAKVAIKGQLNWVTSIGKNIDQLTIPPIGYQFYKYNGIKFLRRTNASNVNTPRLGVKENKIVKYDGQTITNFSNKQVNDLALSSTRIPPSSKGFMLGKYDQDLSKISYNRVAESDNYTYFEMENYDEIYKLVNESRDEMWRINEKIIKDQFNSNGPFFFSHNPTDINVVGAGSFYDQEIELLKRLVLEKHGKTAKFIKSNQYWKLEW